MNAMVPRLRKFGGWADTVIVWKRWWRDDAPSTPDVTAQYELDAESEMPNQISHRHAGDYMKKEDFGELQFRLYVQKRLLSQDYENWVCLFSVEKHEVD